MTNMTKNSSSSQSDAIVTILVSSQMLPVSMSQNEKHMKFTTENFKTWRKKIIVLFDRVELGQIF